MIESRKTPQSNYSRHSVPPLETLGDFTTNWRVIPISGLAIVIGVVSAYVALALLRLIGFFTNLFFYGRLRMDLVSPAALNMPLLTPRKLSRERVLRLRLPLSLRWHGTAHNGNKSE